MCCVSCNDWWVQLITWFVQEPYVFVGACQGQGNCSQGQANCFPWTCVFQAEECLSVVGCVLLGFMTDLQVEVIVVSSISSLSVALKMNIDNRARYAGHVCFIQMNLEHFNNNKDTIHALAFL